MNKLSILCLIVLLLARFSLEADKIWLGYADKDYYLELSQSGSREKAVEACANLNATLVMLKNNATRAKVLSMIPYLTPLGECRWLMSEGRRVLEKLKFGLWQQVGNSRKHSIKSTLQIYRVNSPVSCYSCNAISVAKPSCGFDF